MKRSIKRFLSDKVRDLPAVQSLPFLEHANRLQESRAIEMAELELIYVPIPKAANRSIKLALAHRLGMSLAESDVHALPWKFLNKRQLRASPFFRFTFVRHPLDRLLSCYTQKIVSYERNKGGRPEFWRHGRRFWPQMSFDEFVHEVAKIPDSRSDVHFRSQHTFISNDVTAELPLEFTGKFESMEDDWNRFAPHFDLPLLPSTNKTRHKPWREAYTPELEAIAHERYAVDMKLFGYS